MKDIIIVGAGHGGLVTAAKLAENGYNVTIYEKNKRENLGHDWEDRFSFYLLETYLGIKETDFPEKCWRYRGDCAFVSPAKRKKVVINYNDENRQKIMWRKPLINMLIDKALENGAKINFETPVKAPIINNNSVVGIELDNESIYGDLVIDSAGVFSPIRTQLPESFGIEKMPKRGDLFYGYRAYYNRLDYPMPEVPFEVYLYHEGEQGLSWCCTNEESVDILIGRIEPVDQNKVDEQIEIFKKDHPWIGDKILHGGQFGIIPVRRPLSLMVANGYAAIGDSAFMTTPMNGMGIDLSLNAGDLLARTIIESDDTFTAAELWNYNRDFHYYYGGETAKNEGLKNALLSIPSEGVDFLFENDVIESSDLAGAGKNMNVKSLLAKFKRGMKSKSYFMSIIDGLLKGTAASKIYKYPPKNYDLSSIMLWTDKINNLDIHI